MGYTLNERKEDIEMEKESNVSGIKPKSFDKLLNSIGPTTVEDKAKNTESIYDKEKQK